MANSSKSSQPGNKSAKPGDYTFPIDSVPKEVRDYAVNRLSEGNDKKASIVTAKENGSYYGPVVLNNEKYMVQSVGKDKSTAVVHLKENVSLQGQALNDLDVKQRMNGFNVQIHYSGDKAKAYPFKDQEREAGTGANANKPAPKGIDPDQFIESAREYAKENIKHAAQRSAFIKHMEQATNQAAGRKTPEAAKAQKANQDRAAEQQAEAEAGIGR